VVAFPLALTLFTVVEVAESLALLTVLAVDAAVPAAVVTAAVAAFVVDLKL